MFLFLAATALAKTSWFYAWGGIFVFVLFDFALFGTCLHIVFYSHDIQTPHLIPIKPRYFPSLWSHVIKVMSHLTHINYNFNFTTPLCWQI